MPAGGQLLADVEIVLGVFAGEVAGDRNRGQLVQRGAELVAEGQARPGAGGPAVDDVVGAALAGNRPTWHEPDRPSPRPATRSGPAPPGRERHPHLGVVVVVEQVGDDPALDKPGTAGNDIAHGSSLIGDRAAVNQLELIRSRNQAGHCCFSKVIASTQTSIICASAITSSPRWNVEPATQRRPPRRFDGDVDDQLVVESGRQPELQLGGGDHDVDAPVDHHLIAAGDIAHGSKRISPCRPTSGSGR